MSPHTLHPSPMNILSLDFGLSRIGYAVGSIETGIAFARRNLKNNPDILNALEEIIATENITRVIIGNPKRSNPNQISIIEHIETFIDSLNERFPRLPCSMVDERFSTKVAHAKLREAGVKMKNQTELVDAVSAQIILQDYLDNNLPNSNPHSPSPERGRG